jgi:hypothetical protein
MPTPISATALAGTQVGLGRLLTVDTRGAMSVGGV